MVCSHISVMVENGIFLYTTSQVIFSFQRHFSEKKLINKTETPFCTTGYLVGELEFSPLFSHFDNVFHRVLTFPIFFQMENNNVGKNYPKPYDLKAPFLYFYSSTPVFLLVPFFPILLQKYGEK